MNAQIENKNKKEFFDSVIEQRIYYRKKNAYYHLLLRQYLQFLIPENSSVMEIGCFEGEQLAALKPRRGVGIDFSPKMIARAQKKHPSLDFYASNIVDLELEEKFDYVVINNTIGYVDDLQAAFERIKRVCRSDTKVVMLYHSHLWRPILKFSELLKQRMKWPQQHWLSRKDMENLLHIDDFKVITRKQLILCPFYIPLISTLFNKFIVHLPFFRKFALNDSLVFQLAGQRKEPENVVCSVVIPCRNEKGNIEQAILRTPHMGARTEFIFVEGHSKDGTLEECQRVRDKYSEKEIKVLRQSGKGKGNAVREGFAAATGDVFMILDADLTTPPEDMPKFFNALVQGKGEFINGSRLIYHMEDQAMRFLNMIANKAFSIMLTYLLGQYLKDTLCGTKVLWKEDYFKIEKNRIYFGDFDPFGDFDLLFGAAKLNLKIIEVPVQYKARTYGTTQISRFTQGWLLIKMTLFAMRKIKFI